MILETEVPPPDALSAALNMIAACLSEKEAGGIEMGHVAIPVHRMRPGETGGWDSSVPLVGWAFPLFDAEGLTHVAWVGTDPDEDAFPARLLMDAGPGTAFRDAFDMAVGVGEATSEPCHLRIVQVPGSVEAFWIEGDHDTFVDVVVPRVLAGPEFVALIRSSREGPFDDLIAKASAEEEQDDSADG